MTLNASVQLPDLAARSILLKNSVTETGPSPLHGSIKLDTVKSFALVGILVDVHEGDVTGGVAVQHSF